MLAQKLARDCSQLVALTGLAQTRFFTAVSEMCRNVLDHVGVGEISFALRVQQGNSWLEATVTDQGRGISNPEHWLTTPPAAGGRGYGLYNSRRLVDEFRLESSATHGTRVILGQRISNHAVVLTAAQLQKWRQQLTHNSDVSPYEEVKRQNDELLRLYETLREKNQLTEQQLITISQLNTELHTLNATNELLLEERQTHNLFLERANAELDAFAHTVSHDLKAPLYNIQGLVYLLGEDLKTGDLPAMTHGVELLGQQATWMDRLIYGILEYARAGRYAIEKIRVPVGELVVRVRQSLPLLPGIQVHVAADLPTLLTEEVYLQQIFSNLISNALKHHDLPHGNVWVTAERVGETVEFSVADDGPGIQAEHQYRLFEIFQVISTRPVTGSTGVGLAIVQKIVRDKGGRVWVESAGRGSRFVFTWPAAEVIAT